MLRSRRARPGACLVDVTTRAVGVVRLQKKYSEARTPSCFVLGDETRQRAGQARVMMAPAALQLALVPRCPVGRVPALLSLVALRRAVRGQSASADAAPLSIQGLSFALSRRVSAR